MEHGVILSRDVFNSMIANLLELEEGKKQIIDEYFPRFTQERNEMLTLIDTYILQLEKVLKSVTVAETVSNHFPYIILGSTVKLLEIDSQSNFTYRLVSPLNDRVGSHDVSFLSPLGKTLLLKKVNDIIMVTLPGGTFRYKILSIKLD